jgi:hypothetical protein
MHFRRCVSCLGLLMGMVFQPHLPVSRANYSRQQSWNIGCKLSVCVQSSYSMIWIRIINAPRM